MKTTILEDSVFIESEVAHKSVTTYKINFSTYILCSNGMIDDENKLNT